MKTNKMKLTTLYTGGLKVMLLGVALLASGCNNWKEKFDDCPENGLLTLVTEWNHRSPGVEIPASYRAIVGDYSETLSGLRNVLDHEFAPGNHHVNVYNTPEKIQITGVTATVAASGDGIDAMPGFLFTWAGDVIGLQKDENREILAPMIQQVGVVTYEIRMEDGSDIGNHITAVEATLDNIASQLHIETSALSAPAKISPVFTLQGGKFEAGSRILGVIGNVQTLTMEVTLAGGAGTQTLWRDIAPILDGFNADKLGTYHVVIEITGINQVTGRITDWIVGGDLVGKID